MIHDKILSKLEIEGSFLNLIRNIYAKLTANFTLNGERPNVFLLRSKTRQVCLLSALLFTTVLQVRVRAVRQEEGINGIQIKMKEIKLLST